MKKCTWWPEGDSTCPSPGMKEFDELPWPDSAPFLVAADLCTYDEDGQREPDKPGRFSLGEWVSLSFPNGTCQCCVIEGVLSWLEKRLEVNLHYFHMTEMPKGGSLKVLAEGWNSVLKVLGYSK